MYSNVGESKKWSRRSQHRIGCQEWSLIWMKDAGFTSHGCVEHFLRIWRLLYIFLDTKGIEGLSISVLEYQNRTPNNFEYNTVVSWAQPAIVVLLARIQGNGGKLVRLIIITLIQIIWMIWSSTPSMKTLFERVTQIRQHRFLYWSVPITSPMFLSRKTKLASKMG